MQVNFFVICDERLVSNLSLDENSE